MMRIECDCGDAFDVPEGFFHGGAVLLFLRHGHFPERFTYLCVCGATRTSGRAIQPEAGAAILADAGWYQEHLACELAAAGGPSR